MHNPVITLTSDFGDRFAESQLELVINSLNPSIKFIVAENNIHPFSINEGAFIISKFYSFAPLGSIHIGVVDPGVGSTRKGIIIKSGNYWFIGPDNGLLYPAANQDRIKEVYVIDESKLGSLSNTFHGRDIFAKVAAFISLRRPLLEYAIPHPISSVKTLIFIDNQVVHIDPYGNIKLYAQPNGFILGETIMVKKNEKQIYATYCKTFADVHPGEYLLYNGSHQTLELAINTGSAADQLGIKIEDVLQIQKLPKTI